MKRYHETKTILEPIEKLKVAYVYEIYGIDLNMIAILMDVNSGTVAEAISDVRNAIGLTKPRADELNLER